MSYIPYQPTCLVATGVQVPLTGTTSTITLYSFVLKANTMGLNDMLCVRGMWSMTNSANNKTPSITIAGSNVFAIAMSNVASYNRIVYFINRNSLSSNIANGSGTNGNYGGVGVNTYAINTAVNQTVLWRAALANSGENINLEKASIELYHNLP